MADARQLQTLTDYANGLLGTREAIERAGLEDFGEPLDCARAERSQLAKARGYAGARTWRLPERCFSRACAAMTHDVAVIVTDAPPLITLARRAVTRPRPLRARNHI
jgi:hypothetical protein